MKMKFTLEDAMFALVKISLIVYTNNLRHKHLVSVNNYRFSSDHRRPAASGVVSTWMGDRHQKLCHF